jgi:hypothetical protein
MARIRLVRCSLRSRLIACIQLLALLTLQTYGSATGFPAAPVINFALTPGAGAGGVLRRYTRIARRTFTVQSRQRSSTTYVWTNQDAMCVRAQCQALLRGTAMRIRRAPQL